MTPKCLALPCALAALLLAAPPAAAGVAHTVAPGETLWSIAAANNFTTRALAAANGLPENSNVVLGSTITIPSEGEAAVALANQGAAAPQGAPQAAGTPGAGSPGAGAGATGQAAPPVLGSYTAQPGDSLSAIAARAGVDMQQVAWMNGLDPAKPLLIGTVLKLPASAPNAAPAPAAAPASQPGVVPQAAPQPTPERVSAAQIGQIAANHGVSPSLASAIAWQESGFNNNLVSPANARGVMQILPGTWDWINDTLASQPLNPASAAENVHGGVMYLGQLLRDTGGDEAKAAASYYQGLSSVQRNGFFAETEQYVRSVQALRARFGG